jgi:hypothetical protein
MKLKTARQVVLGAVSACGLAVGYMTGTVPLVARSIDWHGAYCFPHSMLGDQVFNGRPSGGFAVNSRVSNNG